MPPRRWTQQHDIALRNQLADSLNAYPGISVTVPEVSRWVGSPPSESCAAAGLLAGRVAQAFVPPAEPDATPSKPSARDGLGVWGLWQLMVVTVPLNTDAFRIEITLPVAPVMQSHDLAVQALVFDWYSHPLTLQYLVHYTRRPHALGPRAGIA